MEDKIQRTKDQLISALERSLGIVTPACKEVGVSRETFYRYCKDDPAFKKLVDDIDNITLDFVENQLLRKIKDGNDKAILFYMRYKGKIRGYNSSLDITSDNGPISINLNWIKPDED